MCHWRVGVRVCVQGCVCYVQCLFISVRSVCVSTECWSAKVSQSSTDNVIPTLLSPYLDRQGHISLSLMDMISQVMIHSIVYHV